MQQLAQPPYDLQLMMDDYEYVAKKLGFTIQEFDRLLNLPNRSHSEFGVEVQIEKNLTQLFKVLKPIKPAIKWLLK